MLQRQLEADRKRQQALDAENARIADESRRLQTALVEAAAQVRAREAERNTVEIELTALEAQEATAAQAFYERRDQLSGLLAVLQRMGREPPPALVVKPENAASAARSAMLLTAVLPGVRTEAQRLSKDLETLRGLRQAAADSRMRLDAAAAALGAEQVRIAALIAEKKALGARVSVALKAATEKVRALGREATSLTALIGRADSAIQDLDEAGFLDPNFSAKRGYLALPAHGEVLAQYGEVDEFGLRQTGLRLSTRANAQVTSPVDGKVVYADTFTGYGLLLIIGAGDGYHILLSGMARIDAAVGQVLLAGEPVGVMGPAEGQGQDGRRTLRIEFRRRGEPVDPAPWFAGGLLKTRDKGHG